jgi:site-specific DNA recombinase
MPFEASGYRRVSTEIQFETGYSLDAQERAIREFVAHKGWQMGQIYTDAGLSGRLDERPALRQLLHDAEAGQFDVVVVHAIDRFYRSLSGLLTTMELLRRSGVSFVSITENLDFTTPWGKLALAVLGTLAEIYIDKLSAETSKGKRERAHKGQWNGSIPFGYCNGRCSACTDLNGPGYCPHAGGQNRGDGKHLIAHPIEAVGVRRAFELSAGGVHTDRDVADYLNRQVVHYQGQDYPLRPKRRPGDVERLGPPEFLKDTVREMLVRVFYTGVVPYGGVDEAGRKRRRRQEVALYPGQHPALVPQDLFDRVQTARQLRRSAPTPPHKTKRNRVYPLSGLAICGGCGKPMHAASNRDGYRYYRCPSRIQQTDACDQPTVRAELLEEQVADRFRQMVLPPDWRTRLNQALLCEGDKGAARRAAQESLTRVRELYLEGDLDRAEYERQRTIYRERLADLTDVSFASIMATGFLVQHFSEIWDGPDDLNKKRLLQALLAAVTVRGDAPVGWRPNSAFYPLLRHVLPQEGSLCHHGSDGIRTRDLRLDRPTC